MSTKRRSVEAGDDQIRRVNTPFTKGQPRSNGPLQRFPSLRGGNVRWLFPNSRFARQSTHTDPRLHGKFEDISGLQG
jgi:hypothetical protein